MNNFLSRMLALFVLFVLCSPLSASYEKGMQAVYKDDYKTAFKQWKPLAQKGDVNIQATLAVMYHMGQGVKQSYKKAFYWYRKAAEQGNTAAQANLGVMYAKGTGTKRNLIESYAWHSVAAEALTNVQIGSALWGIDYLATLMSTKEINKAKKLTKKYTKKFLKKKK